MARVQRFERITKLRHAVHGPVSCTYSVFTGSDGKRYLQLDTYGSPERQFAGKISQSIQFDASVASELKRVIEMELL